MQSGFALRLTRQFPPFTPLTGYTLLAEVGAEWSKFRNGGAFASYLFLTSWGANIPWVYTARILSLQTAVSALVVCA